MYVCTEVIIVDTCRYKECSKGAHQAHKGSDERQRCDMVP